MKPRWPHDWTLDVPDVETPRVWPGIPVERCEGCGGTACVGCGPAYGQDETVLAERGVRGTMPDDGSYAGTRDPEPRSASTTTTPVVAPVATPCAHAATAPTGEQAIAGLSPCEGRNAA